MTLNLNNLVETVIVPTLQIGFPIAVVFAIVERVANMMLSFVRGDKHVKL